VTGGCFTRDAEDCRPGIALWRDCRRRRVGGRRGASSCARRGLSRSSRITCPQSCGQIGVGRTFNAVLDVFRDLWITTCNLPNKIKRTFIHLDRVCVKGEAHQISIGKVAALNTCSGVLATQNLSAQAPRRTKILRDILYGQTPPFQDVANNVEIGAMVDQKAKVFNRHLWVNVRERQAAQAQQTLNDEGVILGNPLDTSKHGRREFSCNRVRVG
jgi:hypothetical protein